MDHRIGEIIRTARLAKGWTLEDVAAQVGVTKSAVSRWETGNAELGDERKTLLETVLEIDLSDSAISKNWHDGSSLEARLLAAVTLDWLVVARAAKLLSAVALDNFSEQQRGAALKQLYVLGLKSPARLNLDEERRDPPEPFRGVVFRTPCGSARGKAPEGLNLQGLLWCCEKATAP